MCYCIAINSRGVEKNCLKSILLAKNQQLGILPVIGSPWLTTPRGKLLLSVLYDPLHWHQTWIRSFWSNPLLHIVSLHDSCLSHWHQGHPAQGGIRTKNLPGVKVSAHFDRAPSWFPPRYLQWICHVLNEQWALLIRHLTSDWVTYDSKTLLYNVISKWKSTKIMKILAGLLSDMLDQISIFFIIVCGDLIGKFRLRCPFVHTITSKTHIFLFLFNE